jgi:hypothetical protein
VKRFLLIFTIAALVSAMLAIGAPSVTAQQGQGGGTRATVSCAPEWLQEWHQWYDRGSAGGIVGWWYFWWYRWCYATDTGAWFRLYDSWDWGDRIL